MRLKSILAAGVLCAALAAPCAALKLEVDGADATAQAKAFALDGTTYVSLRAVSAMLQPGAQAVWKDGAAEVTAPGLVLTARPGDCYLEANGRAFYMERGVLAVDGSVMVALRPLAAAMGGKVDWDAGRSAALLTTGAGADGGSAAAPYSEEDLYWLSRIISAESRGEPLKGKIAVGTVVLNRVASGEFPDTIRGVIFDARWGGQFEPVRNGTVYNEPTRESVLAAQLCLQGAREAGDSLYFLAPELTNNHWIMDNRTYVTAIGCHWFYS